MLKSIIYRLFHGPLDIGRAGLYTVHYADRLRSYSHVAVHKAAKNAA